MFKIFAVTNRLLTDDFPAKLNMISSARPDAIILREKDLLHSEYACLAIKALDICGDVPLIIHKHIDLAKELGLPVHIPIGQLEEVDKSMTFGVSCHSLCDLIAAEKAGCRYVTAGHIFDTSCKTLPGRGIKFLQEICSHACVPVFAIGGISERNIADVKRAGAAGACVMSGIMTAIDAQTYIKDLRESVDKDQ